MKAFKFILRLASILAVAGASQSGFTQEKITNDSNRPSCSSSLQFILKAHHAKQQTKVEYLGRILSRKASEKYSRKFEFLPSRTVHQLDLTRSRLGYPRLKAPIAHQGDISFSVINKQSFYQEYLKTKKNGFWLLFNPSGPNDRIKTGHFRIVVGDTLFDRMGDGLGQVSMSSKPMQQMASEIADQKGLPIHVAQFFEVSPESVEILEKYFHDRVWYYHQAGSGPLNTQYNPLPYTDTDEIKDGENCLTFSISFLEERFSKLYPKLRDVQEEIGAFGAVQIPIKQLSYNTQSPAYRGTFVISETPKETSQSMLNGSFNLDEHGHQLLFDGAAQAITH